MVVAVVAPLCAARPLRPLLRHAGELTGLLPLYVYSDPVRQERQLLLLGAGTSAEPQVLAWHREALPLLLAADALRLYTLSLEGMPIATLYALIDPPSRQIRTEYFYLVGHSRAHAELKPGVLLTAMASESAAIEGDKIIDMLRGDEAYKKFWHVEGQRTCGFSFEPLALRDSSLRSG